MKIFLLAFLILLSAVHSFAAEQRYTVSLENSPSCGAQNAPVTIIEFLDYQ